MEEGMKELDRIQREIGAAREGIEGAKEAIQESSLMIAAAERALEKLDNQLLFEEIH